MADGEPVLSSAIPALVRLIEEKYPAVDASRVYVTGYSMGSLATLEAIFGDPSVFAAAYPQAGIAGSWPTEIQLANAAAKVEIQTLSTRERIDTIASDNGLKLHQDNIITITTSQDNGE
jgi:predicted peptidase